MLKSWTPLQCKQVAKANLVLRWDAVFKLAVTWPEVHIARYTKINGYLHMLQCLGVRKALGAPPQRYTSGVLICNMNMQITSKSLDKQIVDVLYIQPIRDTLIWWLWKKTHTPPKFNMVHLKMMVPSKESPNFQGLIFRWTMLNFQVIIRSYSFQPIKHTLIWW